MDLIFFKLTLTYWKGSGLAHPIQTYLSYSDRHPSGFVVYYNIGVVQ